MTGVRAKSQDMLSQGIMKQATWARLTGVEHYWDMMVMQS